MVFEPDLLTMLQLQKVTFTLELELFYQYLLKPSILSTYRRVPIFLNQRPSSVQEAIRREHNNDERVITTVLELFDRTCKDCTNVWS